MMPNPKNYDLEYRPKSYWGPQELETHYGARAKGELRRQTGLGLLSEGVVDQGILQPSLDDEERVAVGAIHPWFMGGEYLPDFLRSEVEIARVTMKSTTMDVVSIRARPLSLRISYRIVDEYGDLWGDDHYVMRPKTTKAPLTLKQLVAAIDAADLVNGPRDINYDGGCACSPEEIYDFCTVSSPYYPQLGPWYDTANEDWLKIELVKQNDDDEFDADIEE